ncbi:hypothetical protein CDD82_5930 [Ophiocordyceps australis]|uniref:Uncharacterized protein n=1 Tax=Ophiocordyceps australis TaxID=1399860 RepID=A0A2C5YYD0_9HYPO|nr:hypothetical protein CDD82_5930 [Ophiocordyceps australis]
MEAELLDRLRHKLDQLELGMQTHRCHLLAEFDHFCHHLLRGVPLETACSLQRALPSILGRYPLLRPNTQVTPSHRLGLDDYTSPPLPPVSPTATSGATLGPATARSRQDETQLQGLFTPTYLPLLEAPPMLPRSPPAGSASATGAENVTSTTAPSITQSPLSQPDRDARITSQASLAPTVVMDGTASATMHSLVSDESIISSPPRFPVPLLVRQTSRSTDDTRSSVSSDKSDIKTPRSAMRRSSSTIKTSSHSPRRVRFEFMGAEVLPTSSPQPSELAGPRPSSPGPGHADDDNDDDDDNQDEDDDDTAFDSDLDGESGGDKVPPRKVSSSDALRALSRAPLEEGAAWTVVNPDTDDVGLDELGLVPSVSAALPPANVKMFENQEPDRHGLSWMNNIVKTPTRDSIEHETYEERDGHGTPDDDDDDDDDSSDDGFLAMARTKSSKQKAAQTVAQAVGSLPQPPTRSSNQMNKSSWARTSSPLPKSSMKDNVDCRQPAQTTAQVDNDDAEDDELFQFESEANFQAQSRQRRPSWQPDPESDEQEEKEHEEATGEHVSNSMASIYATSPAIHIRHSGSSQGQQASSVKFQPGSLGSYKGRPLMMPIVRDPEVLALANASKPPGGSLDSVEEQAILEEGSLPRYPNTPGSLKERFIREQMADCEIPDEDSTREIRW